MSEEEMKIDLTPTWASVMPILIAAMQNGTAEGKQIANIELNRMAQMIDGFGSLLASIKQYDAAMTEAEKVPTGDDYNELLRLLTIAG